MTEIKKTKTSYWGECLREVGVLIAVFGPMYLKFESGEKSLELLLDSLLWIFCAIIIVAIGIDLERRN